MSMLIVWLMLLFTISACSFERIRPNYSDDYSMVLVSTLDGHLRALDIFDGSDKWILREDPVLRAPRTVKQGFTFLPNPQDGSLYMLREGVLKKLPFSIPQLVHSSPCQGADGILYAGSKRDVWFGIDPVSGLKVETLSSTTAERFCPANHDRSVFIGRTEYQISMFDSVSKGKAWNASFTDYSAHLLPDDSEYPLKHYVSSSSGSILAVSGSGEIQWARDLKMPVVAMYLLKDDGLHKLSFTVLGKEAMENLAKAAYPQELWNNVLLSEPAVQTSLFPTLYVGDSPYGLYAISALVDQDTITYAPKYLGPPLLDGPTPIAISTDDRAKYVPSQRPILQVRSLLTSTHKTDAGEYLLLGYHEPPALHLGSIIPSRPPNVPVYPSLAYKSYPEHDSKRISVVPHKEPSLSEMLFDIYLKYPSTVGGIMAAFIVFSALLVYTCGRQSGVSALIAADSRSAQTSRVPITGKLPWLSSKTEYAPEGWMNIGKLSYNPCEVLGRGCEGTVVFRGRFGGREVAVKRVVSEFLRLVEREADLLRESDSHPHVIRYFCMESDSQFRYLALELCVASLHDFVENRAVREKIPISSKELLRQATDGLAHLHAMDIVHRDIKPQNVLISLAGQVRAVISDFGLCKRIQPGRHSLSKRSGTAGTDGWIAPEALVSESTGRPVDIFSLGCIFYYVLTDGRHPFGDSLHRQANILNGSYCLNDLKEDVSLSMNLIESMLQRDALLRPSTSEILVHPLFWSSERRLQFFGDVSDRVEKEDDSSPIIRRLERNAKSVVVGGWRRHICQELTKDLRKFRTYKSHSVRDLLRAMRNKKHHYRELPPEVQSSLGAIPDRFLHYWTSRFPQLLLHTYEALQYCSDEPIFNTYYSDEIREKLKELITSDEKQRKEAAEEVNSTQWTRGKVVTAAVAASTAIHST